MITYKTTGTFEKFQTVTNEGFMNGQSIGAANYVYLFENEETIFCIKKMPNGKAVSPCVINKATNNAEFFKYARIFGDETLEDATFSITSQSGITEKETAQKVAEMAIEFMSR